MIDLTKIQYRVVVIDENGTQYNIKEYVSGLPDSKEEASTSLGTLFANIKLDN